MSKIEIFENTLLKLLIRRGADVDRKNVTLSQGELGYTVDTKRLYVGDSQTVGGKLVGNIFGGSVADVTVLSEVAVGDYAFNNNTNTLYILVEETPGNIASWLAVGGIYTPGDTTINISSTNRVTVGTISAANLSRDVLGNSIELDSNNRLEISSTGISTDSIIPRTAAYLSLPQNLRINNVNYSWPSGGVSNGLFLGADVSGNLSWQTPLPTNNFFVSSEVGQIPVGSILSHTVSTNVPSGWLICNGQSLDVIEYPDLFDVIGYQYGGVSSQFNIPNLIDSLMYGVEANPYTGTTYKIPVTATNSNTLSASAVLFIIKAKPDYVANCLITLGSGLTATTDSSSVESFSPLSGNHTIGVDGEFIANLIREQPGFAIPVGATMFTQGAQTNTAVNVTSVSLSSAAYLTGVTGSTYSVNTNSYLSAGYSGVYIIDFTAPIINNENSIVQIQAANWRQAHVPGEKQMMNSVPLYDYGWVSPTRLVVGILSTRYSNSRVTAAGNLINVYVDSGVTNVNTKFSVIVYGG
jgi:hypothetical protein